jgi:hypothetical protein
MDNKVNGAADVEAPSKFAADVIEAYKAAMEQEPRRGDLDWDVRKVAFGLVALRHAVDAFLPKFAADPDVYTGNSTVQDYVLLKAAETAQASGATHFQIISAADASRASTIVSPGSSTTTVVGRQALTTTSPGSVDTVIKPGEDVYVRMLKQLPPGPLPQGTYSAAEIIQFVGSRVQRPS